MERGEIGKHEFFNTLRVRSVLRGGNRLKTNLAMLGVKVRGNICDFDESERWDLLERASAQYVYWRKRLHPDYGGEAEKFIALQAAWMKVKELFGRMGYELHKETINRDEKVCGVPLEEEQVIVVENKPEAKPVLRFPVSKEIAEICLEEVNQVDGEFGGRFGVDKNALAIRRVLIRLGVALPEVGTDGHVRLIQALRYMSNSTLIRQRARKSIHWKQEPDYTAAR